MRVLFCGGGTAGHVNPAIAVAETILRNSPQSKVAYVTTMNGIENQLVDFKKYQIDVIGLKRKITFKNVSCLVKQIRAIKRCKEIIREFRPDIIFGTGGYASYPVIIAGKKLGVKTVLHESNAIPGKAVLSLQGKADKIFINFEESRKYFKNQKNIVHTGNPVRKGFVHITKADAKSELKITQKNVILVTAGTLGSKRINSYVIELIENYIRHNKDVFLIWSAGKNQIDSVNYELEKRHLLHLDNVMVRDYYKNIYVMMAAADVVISRAGAMTVSELAYMKKAVVLVPSPNVTNNHQYLNAKAIEKAGAAVLITEDRLYTLIDTVKDVLSDMKFKNELETGMEKLFCKNANKEIYNELLNLI